MSEVPLYTGAEGVPHGSLQGLEFMVYLYNIDTAVHLCKVDTANDFDMVVDFDTAVESDTAVDFDTIVDLQVLNACHMAHFEPPP